MIAAFPDTIGNPDQDPKPYVGYPRGGWVFTDLSDVSPLISPHRLVDTIEVKCLTGTPE